VKEKERLLLQAELFQQQRDGYATLGLDRPGVYLHAVSLQDMARWNNFVLAGWHVAPGWAIMDPAFAGYESVRDVSIERVRDDPPVNVTSAFAADRIYSAAIIRRGGHIGQGIDNTKWLTSEKEAELLRAGDIELAFEAGRRRVAPEAASRLASLFVADDTLDGERNLREMFGHNADLWLLRVGIPAAIRFTKADARWFDAYWEDPREEYVEAYWSQELSPGEGNRWEYLVEGVLKMVDEKQMAKLRRVGAMALGLNVSDE
jgi:hypothetical protein